jgi:hypothetical protein
MLLYEVLCSDGRASLCLLVSGVIESEKTKEDRCKGSGRCHVCRSVFYHNKIRWLWAGAAAWPIDVLFGLSGSPLLLVKPLDQQPWGHALANATKSLN